MSRRVVITGIGAVTPIGNNTEEFWNGAKEGKNGIDNITYFDTTDYKVKLGAQLKDFNIEDYMTKKEAKRMDRYCQYAMAAAKEAIENSKLNLDTINTERIGILLGTGIGGLTTIEEQIEKLAKRGPSRISPLSIPMGISNMAAGNVAIKYGIKGPCSSIVTACASATHSIGEAYRNIKHGYSDIMISGGSEAAICPFAIAGFQSLTALTKSEDKNRASIPFDKERSGFVMGEGAGILILEELESALKREATIYGEIVGYGTTCDAYHMTSPSIDGEGAARAMDQAIAEADIEKGEVGYINAHGTSTEINDKVETLAIKRVFGENAYNIPISSTKGMTGHLLGAAGAIEAIISIKALQEGFLPATINYNVKDEHCDLDYIINEGRKKEIEYAMSNSLGFGGHNGVLVFKKWKGLD